MARKKEIKVESRDEWRDRQIEELTLDKLRIVTFDIEYTLKMLNRLQGDVSVLMCLLSEKYKNRLRKKYRTDDIDGINKFDIKKYCDKIEVNLLCLEPALNSVKQIKRLPSVAEIVRMIESGKEVRL